MSEFSPENTLADAIAGLQSEVAGLRDELKAARADLSAARDDIRKVDRRVVDFRSSYDHHAAQEARVHAEIREDISTTRVSLAGSIAEANAGIKELSTAIVRIDTRVGVLESA
jgi:chromosome segregation ATPase